ncbi:hypothetical protein Nepgr_019198 [Nepenthes gracilis]|uniref:PPM-type phosphatase domain-containing protein n=1 Tax=Nepenthes gracilis TaxID=150966 RepID=A0AAD3SVD9_NEPGR|nr:hypothetical protein Nepgr_019198 [Nepenthes gracilis]
MGLVLEEFLSGFSILALVLYFFRLLEKAISMATSFGFTPFPPPSPSSWAAQVIVKQLGATLASKRQIPEELYVPKDNEEIDSVMREQTICDALEKASVRENSPKNDVSDSLEMVKRTSGHRAEHMKLRKRPSRLVVPEYAPAMEFRRESRKIENIEFEIEGMDYCMASKKGKKESMEDRYRVITDIAGDPRQAFFAVIDGHGGHAAAEYVAENLGKNIVEALGKLAKSDDHGVEQAICEGYSITDRNFLDQGVGSGACAASVLMKDGELHVANVGDCRAVLSRNGLATRLTNDHHPNREDERSRIEGSGGYVEFRYGAWRVQGFLAVSRAIGDLHLKQWITSEPEISKVQLTPDCQFLIVASDGLWNKVDEQEAVDVVIRDRVSADSCKKLVDMSCARGNKDDITVVVINLQNFEANGRNARAQ